MGRSSGSRIGRFRVKHLETKNLWVQGGLQVETHQSCEDSERSELLQIRWHVFSATNILRDHMRLVNCELIDHQEHFLVGVSFSLTYPVVTALGIKDCQAEGSCW